MTRFCLGSRRTYKILIFSALILSLSLSAFVSVRGSDTEIRVINPTTDGTNFVFHSNSTFAGDRFNVTLFVLDVSDLNTFQVSLKYNSTVLNPGRAWLPTDEADYFFWGKNTIPGIAFYFDDPVWGTTVLVGDAILGYEGVSGSGLLAIIEFEIVKEPSLGEVLSCDLDIDNTDTFLDDSLGEGITTVKTKGYYQYTWVELLELFLQAKPSHFDAAELETFDITVWLNNTTPSHKLVNVTFKLSYEPMLLSVTQVTEGSFLAEIGNTTFNYVNETGDLTVLGYLTPPYASFPEGNGQIAIITFQGIYQDRETRSCDVQLHSIQLFDNNMNPVPAPSEFSRHSAYTISPATSSITINVPAHVVVGYHVNINGSITPNPGSDVEVTIHVDGSNFSALTDINGHYIYTWIPTESAVGKELYMLYSSWLGDNVTLGDESVREDVWVQSKRVSTITVNVSPGSIVLVGEDVTITGKIEVENQPFHAHVNVTIEYKHANETSWIRLTTVETDSQGRYNYAWPEPEIGQYEIRVKWLGDASTVGAVSDEITVEIAETLPVDIMAYVPYVVVGIVIILAVILYFKKFRKS